jgi:hypothetical protein
MFIGETINLGESGPTNIPQADFVPSIKPKNVKK